MRPYHSPAGALDFWSWNCRCFRVVFTELELRLLGQVQAEVPAGGSGSEFATGSCDFRPWTRS
jgi:hypothetical protein